VNICGTWFECRLQVSRIIWYIATQKEHRKKMDSVMEFGLRLKKHRFEMRG